MVIKQNILILPRNTEDLWTRTNLIQKDPNSFIRAPYKYHFFYGLFYFFLSLSLYSDYLLLTDSWLPFISSICRQLLPDLSIFLSFSFYLFSLSFILFLSLFLFLSFSCYLSFPFFYSLYLSFSYSLSISLSLSFILSISLSLSLILFLYLSLSFSFFHSLSIFLSMCLSNL